MNKITEYIVQINSLNYNKQSKYVKNKILSIKFCDITHIMFFKKVQVIFKKLPIYLKEIDNEINQERNHSFNFFYELDDRSSIKCICIRSIFACILLNPGILIEFVLKKMNKVYM